MIPLKLTLHNFICYRDPEPLDFAGLHLVCLAGNNGHGKSALLDAMTWALWGQARSNSADDLIHLGQSDMWVDFEFALGENRYRVVRSRERRGKSGKSDLQLQVWAGEGREEGEFRPITEPTIRDTEQRIVDLLRMDYDTFINSAFLVQGRADEFTVKPANQRKQILADILGLGLYDDYEARAKERAREKREGATLVQSMIASIDQELAREEDYRQELAEMQAQLLASGEDLRLAEGSQRDLHTRRQELLGQRRALEDLQSRLQRGERELADIEEQLGRDEGRLAADASLLAQAEEIEAGYGRLQALRRADQDWNAKLARMAALQAQASRLEGQIAQARHQLESERRVLAERQAQAEAQAARAGILARSLEEARSELSVIAGLEEEKARLQSQHQALQEDKASLGARNGSLRELMDDLKEKLEILNGAQANCPVCNQPLGPAERERVLADYQAQGKALGDEFRSNKERVDAINLEGRQVEANLAELEKQLRAKNRWQRQEGQAEAQLAEAEAAQATLAAVEQDLALVARRLEAGDYAAQAQAERAQVEGQVAGLGYDAAVHSQVRDALVDCQPLEESHSQLQAATQRRQDLETRIERLRAGQARWQEALQADRERREALAGAVAELPGVEAALRARSEEVQRLEGLVNQARQRVGAAQQKLDACRAQAQRRQELSGQLEDLLARQALFEELQVAFGKRGLQAMIIEAAIPEIESEANKLLNRMTDGRMAVRMETQKETKTTGALRETLDIIISDELGSRDYSMFSGGEAFRANFAIRIALSKLLARRAGARLQTLIVDEGFGTQDAQGRERLVEAITSIQDEFERVLVITHIDELKDLFPARIDVVKTAEGSQISVS